MRLPRGLAGATVVFATLAVAGCGGADPKPAALSPAEVLVRVAEQTATAESATFAVDLSLPGKQVATMKVSGAFQGEPAPAVRLTVADLAMGGMRLPLDMEMRALGDVVYIRLPMLVTRPGKPWLKTSLAEASKSVPAHGDLLERLRVADPRLQVRQLLASKDVREVGKERIDGVDVTHYAGSFPAGTAPGATGAGADRLDFDVWVDGDFLPRRLTMAMPTGAGPVQVTTKIIDQGRAEPITAPPADQIADIGALQP